MSEEKITPVYEEMLNGRITDIGGKIDFNHLPHNWRQFNLEYFSDDKTLYDFQTGALKNFLQFFHAFNSLIEAKDDFSETKITFFQDLPKKNIIENNPKDFRVQVNRGKIREISHPLRERYRVKTSRRYGTEYEEIDFHNFVNRMGFWIATGGGKTLILIKLLEILDTLQREGEIPERDILILSARQDLKEQIEKHIQEYNQFHDRKIKVWDLKDDYAEVKGGGRLTSKEDINVFTYRSDLISDETKETEISFEDFENNGEWYLLLDEAHKGESDDSKRQMYFSMLTRNGFLFNFSATFTHPWDIITTVFEHNLISFTENGFGKKIYLSDEDFRGLSKREKEDIDESEKRKIVLKTLILLTAAKKARENIEFEYHEPLLTCFANSVNVKSSDLELVVQELEKVAQSHRKELFNAAKSELYEELSENSEYETTKKEEINVNLDRIRDINKQDLLQEVFHAQSHSAMEKVYSPDNKMELMFKLKTASKPFALVKIGDVVPWVRDKFPQHPVEERVTGFGSYFESLDDEDNPINLLLGSRAFYEGTDTNRPNILIYDYIGIGSAQKFVLQSLGRGMRIEPLEDQRKRLNFTDIDTSNLSEKDIQDINYLESLFVFGTSMDNLEDIINAVATLRKKERPVEDIEKNPDVEGKSLLVPVFKKSKASVEDLSPLKADKDLITNYLDWIDDDRLLLAQFPSLDISKIKRMKKALNEAEFKYENMNSPQEAVQTFIADVTSQLEKYDGLEEVGDRIIHFERINIRPETEKDFDEITEAIKQVKEAEDPEKVKVEYKNLLQEEEIDLEEYTDKIENLRAENPLEKTLSEYDLKIKKELSNHYYLPYLISESEKQTLITHIIDQESEVEFVKELTDFVQSDEVSILNEVDWWYFSKLDETLDQIYIPYTQAHNMNEKFKPDFIFWFKSDQKLHILFVEPTSYAFGRFMNRIDAYKKFFEREDIEEPKTFRNGDLEVKVHLALYTIGSKEDVPGVEYRKYWFDNVASIFSDIFQ